MIGDVDDIDLAQEINASNNNVKLKGVHSN
jgi:hypothetical protein